MRGDHQRELIRVRESHMVSCEACGLAWDEWDTSIPLDEALATIERDPTAIDGLLSRPCPRCGHPIEWDAAIVPDSQRGTLAPSRQRRLAATLRRLLREGADSARMAEVIRERYGVTDFYVRTEPGGSGTTA